MTHPSLRVRRAHRYPSSFPDSVRGVLSESGLFGEREDWRLSCFDKSNRTARALSDGLQTGKSGVGFLGATFALDIPEEVDAMVSFQFGEDQASCRALLFVNEWKFGKRVVDIGRQTQFLVPPRILDYNGKK